MHPEACRRLPLSPGSEMVLQKGITHFTCNDMDTIIIVASFAVGMLIGALINRRSKRLTVPSWLSSVIICILLFLLGIEIGSDHDAINSLGQIGISALLLTIGAVVCSVLLGWGMWRFIGKYMEKKNQPSHKQ